MKKLTIYRTVPTSLLATCLLIGTGCSTSNSSSNTGSAMAEQTSSVTAAP